MKGLGSVGLLLVFAAASASDAYADGRSGGGRGGGRAGGHAGRSPGAYAGPRSSHGGGGQAVPRGSVVPGHVRPPTGAQLRHPRAGTGTGGYPYGHRYHGRYPYYGHYRPYGYYPYRGYYSYPGYGLPGLGLSFFFGGGYPAPYYTSPYYYAAPPSSGVAYYGGAGGGYAPAPAPEPADAAVLLLEIVPEDASVWIDGEFAGPARELGRVTVPPGRHHIEVVRPGFRSHAEEVDLQPESVSTLRIELQRP
jgi:hypothetical protein